MIFFLNNFFFDIYNSLTAAFSTTLKDSGEGDGGKKVLSPLSPFDFDIIYMKILVNVCAWFFFFCDTRLYYHFYLNNHFVTDAGVAQP